MIIFAYIFSIIFLFLILKIFGLSIKIILRFVFNALIGGIVISIMNLLGANITLTWITK